MKKIILIGVPGSGKSTLGKKLADALRLPFFDTDELMIEKAKPERPTDIFRMSLNGQLIQAQKYVMLDLSENKEPAVISTGAEVALIPACAYLMKKMGTIIHVQRKPEFALADMKKRSSGLVMTMDGEEVDMEENCLKEYMKEYSKYKALADLHFENNGSDSEGLENLIEMIQAKKYQSKE